MRSIIIHDGPVEHALVLTSLVEGLYRQHGVHDITWVTSPQKAVFFRYMPRVTVLDINHFMESISEPFDLCVNFGGSSVALICPQLVTAERYCGLYSVDASPEDALFAPQNALGAKKAYEVLYEGRETKQNLFQVLFQMADLVWRGEGYRLRYYPRAKTKSGCLGLAVSNEYVKGYLRQNLEVTEKQLWHVPIKSDALKQFDEVNRVDRIITDDAFVMHVAVALRKHVQYLLYEPAKIRPEFFNNGFSHVVPHEIAGLTSFLS